MNVILCGFPGSGKSTVGAILAEMLGFSFVDTDKEIERQAGKSVGEIFAAEGEAAFREREAALCADLAKKDHRVIAVGGGTFENEQTVCALSQNGRIIWLRISEETALARLAHSPERPLFAGDDPEKKIRALYQRRLSVYEKAATVTVSGEESPRMVAETIKKQWRP